MVSLSNVPYGHVLEALTQEKAAGDATAEIAIFNIPFKGTIFEVAIVPTKDITGQPTNYFNLNVKTRKADGSGAKEIANRDYNASTVTETLGVKRVLFSGAEEVEENGSVSLERELVGTGLATPPLQVIVKFNRA